MYRLIHSHHCVINAEDTVALLHVATFAHRLHQHEACIGRSELVWCIRVRYRGVERGGDIIFKQQHRPLARAIRQILARLCLDEAGERWSVTQQKNTSADQASGLQAWSASKISQCALAYWGWEQDLT